MPVNHGTLTAVARVPFRHKVLVPGAELFGIRSAGRRRLAPACHFANYLAVVLINCNRHQAEKLQPSGSRVTSRRAAFPPNDRLFFGQPTDGSVPRDASRSKCGHRYGAALPIG
jgi:hypothetical protein